MDDSNSYDLKKALTGCLLGTAVGDAFGLPMEGLSRSRQLKIYRKLDGYNFLLGRGMISDDTEHACMVARALIESKGDGNLFINNLAGQMRWWLAKLPAGTGLATLKSLLKLWIGYSPQNSGVFSAGNGPAMRSATIGVCYGGDRDKCSELVRLSTRITHTDPKAEYGSYAVALAAYKASTKKSDPIEYINELADDLRPEAKELLELAERAAKSAQSGYSTRDFAQDLGLGEGVGGYIYHTVPVALHAWFRYPDNFEEGLIEAVRCGGDTDTVGAIVGAIIGAGVGREGIPEHFIDTIIEWPMTIEWISELAERLAQSVRGDSEITPPDISALALFLRNIFFLVVVFAYGFRRLLPPY
ncbi:ADP-ribosylglycohydrolase family protein [Candidatus Latescibacterota bacterium]